MSTHMRSPAELEETIRIIHGAWFPQETGKMDEAYDFEYDTKDKQGRNVTEIHTPIVKNETEPKE